MLPKIPGQLLAVSQAEIVPIWLRRATGQKLHFFSKALGHRVNRGKSIPWFLGVITQIFKIVSPGFWDDYTNFQVNFVTPVTPHSMNKAKTFLAGDQLAPQVFR